MTEFTSLADLTSHFTHEYPNLVRLLKHVFRHLKGDNQDEAVQNVICLAWKYFRRLFEQGRATPDLLKSVVWYAVRQTACGRMIQGTGGIKAKDALTYRNHGRIKFEITDLDGLIGNRTAVLDAVVFKVDVPAFMDTLSERQRRLAYDLALGETTSDVARKHGVTPGAISQFRRRFKDLYESYFAA